LETEAIVLLQKRLHICDAIKIGCGVRSEGKYQK
jgi:hypothetical protein